MSNKLLQIRNIKKQYYQKGQKPIEALKGVTFDIYQR